MIVAADFLACQPTQVYYAPISCEAIAAGYLGLISVLPLFGVFAIALGCYALAVLKKNPELCGRGRAIFGIVMEIVFTTLYAVLLLADF